MREPDQRRHWTKGHHTFQSYWSAERMVAHSQRSSCTTENRQQLEGRKERTHGAELLDVASAFAGAVLAFDAVRGGGVVQVADEEEIRGNQSSYEALRRAGGKDAVHGLLAGVRIRAAGHDAQGAAAVRVARVSAAAAASNVASCSQQRTNTGTRLGSLDSGDAWRSSWKGI